MIQLSVIIPVYNVEKYIEKCVRSILEQTCSDIRMECVIVDDCSPDQSIQILHSVVDHYQGDASFVFLRHEQNRGISAARNTGMKAAKGDYVLFIDSDDWLPEASLERLVNCLKKHPDSDFVAGNYFNRRENRAQPVSMTYPMVFDNYTLRKGFLNYQDVACTAWNKLLRKDVLQSHPFPEGVIFEDNIWAYELFCDVRKAVITPEVTYVYENDNPQSITNTSESPQKVKMHVKSVVKLGKTIIENTYNDLYAESVVFLLVFLVTALRLHADDYSELQDLRKKFSVKMLKSGHLFLGSFFFFFTSAVALFFYDMGWVRRHFYLIGKFGVSVSRLFS